MDRLLHYYFNLDYMAKSFPALLGGLGVTVEIAAWTIVGGLTLGLSLAHAAGLPGSRRSTS